MKPAYEHEMVAAKSAVMAMARRRFRVLDPEDVYQEACLKAIRKIHQFRGECAFRTWFISVAINMAKMMVRSLTHVDDHTRVWDTSGSVEELHEKGIEFPAPEHSLDDQIFLREVMPRISKNNQKAMRLRFVMGLDTREAAAIIGISPAGLKSAVHHGRLQFLRAMNVRTIAEFPQFISFLGLDSRDINWLAVTLSLEGPFMNEVSFLIYVPAVPSKDEDEKVYMVTGEDSSARALSVLEVVQKNYPTASLWVKVQL